MAALLKQSSFRVNAHEKRVDDECKQLLIDIRRIGDQGTPSVSFGDLFDDEQVEQYYEALVGTLKCAKKRGLIHYKGQMLLKGMHDKVVISILDGTTPTTTTTTTQTTSTKTPTPTPTPAPFKTPTTTTSSSTTPKHKPRAFTFSPKTKADRRSDSAALPLSLPHTSRSDRNPSSAKKINQRKSFSARHLRKKQSSPIKIKKTKDILGTLSDSEGWEDHDNYNHNNNNNADAAEHNQKQKTIITHIFTSSDTEADWTVRKSPRRTPLPSSVKKTREGRPPAPWRIRKAQSMASILPERRPLAIRRWSGQKEMLQTATEAAINEEREQQEQEQQQQQQQQQDEEENSPKNQIKLQTPPKTFKAKPINTEVKERKPAVRPPPTRAKTVKDHSEEAASRMNDEVVQLLVDIRRVGSGETVTFGNLFDDDIVQNTYEALVGTLRSAKKRGLIHYKGQMLLKGMHDKVVISIKQEGNS